MGSNRRWVTVAPVVAAAAWLGACDYVTAPVPTAPYLAVVTTVVAPERTLRGARYLYHIRELSGEIGTDTVVAVAPRDTIILPVLPATYTVEIGGLSPQCHSREGRQAVVVQPNTNTTVVRYFVVCQSQLSISMHLDGAQPDSVFVYHLATAGGVERVGLMRRTDTLYFEALPVGRTAFDLGDVAQNCAVTSDGGAHRTLDLDSTGGAHLEFVVHCSDPAHQPRLLDVRATYRNGVAGLVFRGGDPDRDMDRYSWDLTDCRRKSLLPSGRLTLGGLRAGRTDNRDTITVLIAFDIGIPDSAARNACMALWLADSDGNLSEVWERSFSSGGTPPSATTFNAHFLGMLALRTELGAQDPDGDFLGVFVKMQLRDGTFGPQNGFPDSRFFSYTGDLGTTVPDVGMYAPLTYDKYQSVVVYLLDARANVTRLEDADLFN